jgi:hypothetical protein
VPLHVRQSTRSSLAGVCWLEEAESVKQKWAMAVFCLGCRLRSWVGADQGYTQEWSVRARVVERACMCASCADWARLCGVVERVRASLCTRELEAVEGTVRAAAHWPPARLHLPSSHIGKDCCFFIFVLKVLLLFDFTLPVPCFARSGLVDDTSGLFTVFLVAYGNINTNLASRVRAANQPARYQKW